MIKTSVARRKERDLLHFSMVRTKMDSTLLVMGFCSVLCSFNILPRLILCNFSLCRKRPVGFLSFSSLPLSTWKLWTHKNMWTEHQNKLSWPFVSLLAIGSIGTAQNHRGIQMCWMLAGKTQKHSSSPGRAWSGTLREPVKRLRTELWWMVLVTEA